MPLPLQAVDSRRLIQPPGAPTVCCPTAAAPGAWSTGPAWPLRTVRMDPTASSDTTSRGAWVARMAWQLQHAGIDVDWRTVSRVAKGLAALGPTAKSSSAGRPERGVHRGRGRGR